MLEKVCEVFTEAYREEIKYREFMERELDTFKLNNKSEDVEDKINRLSKKEFESNFRIEIGEYK